MCRAQLLARREFLGPAIIKARLYDLGDYPGIKNEPGEVVGELYSVSKETLRQLDKVEGYEKGDQNCLFVRATVEAQDLANGRFERAEAYFYNHQLSDELNIASGDYRRYKLEQEAGPQAVVAYGSNLSVGRLEERVGKLPPAEPGLIKGFTLVFNKKADAGNWTYANIKYAGAGTSCPAVVYRLSPKQIELLDGDEGVSAKHYLRIGLPFSFRNGDEALAEVYVAYPDRLTDAYSPKDYYLDFLRAGYEEHGLDKSYLEKRIAAHVREAGMMGKLLREGIIPSAR